MARLLPFAPEIRLPTLPYLYEQYRTNIWTGCGFCNAFSRRASWWDPEILGTNQGTLLLLLENYLTQSVGRKFMLTREQQRGLVAAGLKDFPHSVRRKRRRIQAGDFKLDQGERVDPSAEGLSRRCRKF